MFLLPRGLLPRGLLPLRPRLLARLALGADAPRLLGALGALALALLLLLALLALALFTSETLAVKIQRYSELHSNLVKVHGFATN